ncbi:DUF1385 domain-containing protein [Chloroflexota bacterium]
MARKFYYGGQAVIEGVMMRGRKNVSIAVRNPEGNITLHDEPLSTIYNGRLRDIPLIRGVIVLVETLILGMKALFYSASASLGEEEEKINPVLLWGTVALGIVLAVGLFLVLPLFVIRYIDPHVGSVESNIIEGLIRIALFIGYLRVITMMPDIRRVFAYHGAEHKTINAYEAGVSLEVESVQEYDTAHSRCGTSFLLIVLVISIIAFAFLGRPPMWLRLLSRLALMPVIAGVSYEIIRLGAGHIKNSMVRVLLAPGLLLQSMTARQPDDQQVEVAILALKGVLVADRELVEEAAPITCMADGADGVNPE